MKKVILFITIVLIGFSVSFGQGTVSRPIKQKTEQKNSAPKKKAQLQRTLTPSKMFNKGLAAYKNHSNSGAVSYWREAAEQGNGQAQNNLGYMYFNGWGVAQDYAEAVKWWHKAAEEGNRESQYNLGVIYFNGWGVAQDYAEAVKWWRKAADQGDAVAQSNLGYTYFNGKGVAQDYAEAVKWWRKAAAQGYGEAQQNLGIMYHNGWGIIQNRSEAKKWQDKAKAKGFHSTTNLPTIEANGVKLIYKIP